MRFGINICYDNAFPELALLHDLNNVDLILAPHAGRTGNWPDPLTNDFCLQTITHQQASWEVIHRARAIDHNVFVLLCNTVGTSTQGLEDVIANHAGTVMGIDPHGEVFLRTNSKDFSEEIVTITLEADKRKINHGPTRNRNYHKLKSLFHAE